MKKELRNIKRRERINRILKDRAIELWVKHAGESCAFNDDLYDREQTDYQVKMSNEQ